MHRIIAFASIAGAEAIPSPQTASPPLVEAFARCLDEMECLQQDLSESFPGQPDNGLIALGLISDRISRGPLCTLVTRERRNAKRDKTSTSPERACASALLSVHAALDLANESRTGYAQSQLTEALGVLTSIALQLIANREAGDHNANGPVSSRDGP